MKLTEGKRWIWVDKICHRKHEFEAEEIKNVRTYDPSRWFNQDDELLHFEGKTYAFSNQHGGTTYDFVSRIFNEYPSLHGEIEKNES